MAPTFLVWYEKSQTALGGDDWPTRFLSSRAASSTTVVHSIIFFCLNILMLGYQLVLSPENPQRQQLSYLFSIQTGFPIAPAKWATAVSTLITRSRFCIIAAVSAKSEAKATLFRSLGSVSSPSFCREWNSTPSTSKIGMMSFRDMLLLESIAALSARFLFPPLQQSPTFSDGPFIFDDQCSTSSSSGLR